MPNEKASRQYTCVQTRGPAYRRSRDLPRLLGAPAIPVNSPVPPDYSLRLLRRLLRQWRMGRNAPLPSARYRAVAARIAFRGELLTIRHVLAENR